MVAKKTVAVYLSQECIDFLAEMTHEKRLLKYGGSDKRSVALEAIVTQFAYGLLKGTVSDRQVAGVQTDPRRLLKLAVFVMRAERGEPGYVRVPGPMSWHGDNEPTADEIKAFRLDKKNQYVVGPGGEAP